MSLSLYKSVLNFVFPKELLRYFDLVDVQSHDIAADKRHGLESGELLFYFDELDDFRCGEEGHTYRPNGFFEASKVHDFPLRDKKVTLVLRRRRWVDELTGKSVSNTYSLTTEGTRHSVEFVAFLKECFGYVPDIRLFA
ncbi:MAG: hypothetical protein UDS46_06990 [Bacteroidales bacterium]|jgi:hypothetical protein|nr:hypothetical protein [Bacteroidales bacterium]